MTVLAFLGGGAVVILFSCAIGAILTSIDTANMQSRNDENIAALRTLPYRQAK